MGHGFHSFHNYLLVFFSEGNPSTLRRNVAKLGRSVRRMVAKKLIANLQLTRNPRSGGMTCPRGEWTTFEWAPLPKSRLFWSMWRGQGSMLGSSIMQARKMSCNTACDPWISGVDLQVPLFKRDHVNPASPLGVFLKGVRYWWQIASGFFKVFSSGADRTAGCIPVEVANFPIPWQPGRYKPAVCSSRVGSQCVSACCLIWSSWSR